MSRRRFIASSMAAAAVAGSGMLAPAQEAAKKPSVCVFSKHLQFLGYEDLAKNCKKMMLDGVDLTVRTKGHVEPAKVAEDLPRAVAAIRAEGLDVPMITTALNRADDPDADPILKTASDLGIRYFRIGGMYYEDTPHPMKQLDTFVEHLKGLAELAEKYNMVAGYHNHSGYHNVGAPLWDLYALYQRVGSDHLGSNFDVGHAKAEGAYGAWQITAHLMAPYVKMMAVKDFEWLRDKPRWIRLGTGIVPVVEFLKIFREEADFAGPISLHFEYEPKSEDALLAEIAQTVVILRGMLQEAGYA